MIDISVHELNKYYGANHVLKGVSFEIYSGERVGLLGDNGSGKTTLFKVICEKEFYESGTISKASGKKIEVLDQIPVFDEGDTVEDILRSSFKEIAEVYEAMKKLEGKEDTASLTKYGDLLEKYELLGGYDIDTKVEKICAGMDISFAMRNSLFDILSGGEKTRVNLARILLRDCDILLLDEPSNHLDLPSLKWLEDFLRDFKGTVVVISHDRMFLDNVVKRIIEIEDGKAHFYSGNYTFFAEEKIKRYTLLAEQYERQQKEIKRIEERAKWFVQNNRFTTKHHAILSRVDHMEKIERPTASRKINEDFTHGGHSAKEVLSFEAVSKSYDGLKLLKDINFVTRRNDRIAIIGANGCGKTTLIKMIMGDTPQDIGEIKVSSNVTIAYMSQNIIFDDPESTVLDTLKYASSLPENKVRTILSKFLFDTEGIAKKVKHLSGGEKSRLKLCLLMQNESNLLILDEPTNHLDISSREWIENAVADWGGTMIFISHDRFFLNKFATKIWSIKDGALEVFDGSFEEYLALQSPVQGKRNKKKNS